MSKRITSRLAWSICAVSVALLTSAVIFRFLSRSTTVSPDLGTWQMMAIYAAAGLVLPVLGAMISSRRPENPIGWILCAFSLAAGVEYAAEGYAVYALLDQSLPGGMWAAWVSSWVWTLSLGLLPFVFLLFPDGRLPSLRWRPVAWFAALLYVALPVGYALLPGPLESFPAIENPLGYGGVEGEILPGVNQALSWITLSLTGLVSALSLSLRFRRSTGVERQQIKWVAYAAILLVFYAFVAFFFQDTIAPVIHILDAIIFGIFYAAITVAILRHHLFDIDLIISRTLVYGTLTASVVLLYVLVVGGLGELLQVRGNLIISLIATGLAAVMFQPLRERLQRTVNRLMYGERHDPYAVLSSLGQRLESSLAPDAVLPAAVRTVAETLKLPYVAVEAGKDGTLETVAATGEPARNPLRLPLAYGGEAVGSLILAPRAGEEGFSPADRRLLEDLAHQIGVATHAFRLTADLQKSREELVNTREEERRRLRRDLHDGLGPRLAAQTLKVGSARQLYERDPAAADALLSGLESDMEAALDDIRRLVYDLRPPALDELGLLGALRESAARYDQGGPTFVMEAPQRLPELPAAVEVAAYRITQEAMTNVVRHAKARECVVRISAGIALEVEVSDDGTGMPEIKTPGVGFFSMRERAEELGGECKVERIPDGGTRVLARLPLPAPPDTNDQVPDD
jgi:signal transduction histidine kinase